MVCLSRIVSSITVHNHRWKSITFRRGTETLWFKWIRHDPALVVHSNDQTPLLPLVFIGSPDPSILLLSASLSVSVIQRVNGGLSKQRWGSQGSALAARWPLRGLIDVPGRAGVSDFTPSANLILTTRTHTGFLDPVGREYSHILLCNVTPTVLAGWHKVSPTGRVLSRIPPNLRDVT